jgi:hypothetical protein
LHERTSPDGKTRLVAVNLHSAGCFGERTMIARVFVPASLFSQPREVIGAGGSRSVTGTAKVYSATCDSSDPSHFVITYEDARQRCVLDGWLTDDDRVVLEERRSPLAAVTP